MKLSRSSAGPESAVSHARDSEKNAIAKRYKVNKNNQRRNSFAARLVSIAPRSYVPLPLWPVWFFQPIQAYASHLLPSASYK